MAAHDSFVADLTENLGHLRAFAHLLARDHATAEDLVQDTVERALAHRHQFRPGTNLKGWLIIILRNRFFNVIGRLSYRTEVHIDQVEDLRSIDGGQVASIEIEEFKEAFATLPASQREALLLVGANGMSYEEAADITGVPVGTVKSRVSRARADLAAKLEGIEAPLAMTA